MDRPGRIYDARIVNPAFFVSLWKILVSRRYSVHTSVKPRTPCFLFLNALLLPCNGDSMRAPLRFDTVILNGTVTAGTGAAAYQADGLSNDARAGMGVIYEGR